MEGQTRTQARTNELSMRFGPRPEKLGILEEAYPKISQTIAGLPHLLRDAANPENFNVLDASYLIRSRQSGEVKLEGVTSSVLLGPFETGGDKKVVYILDPIMGVQIATMDAEKSSAVSLLIKHAVDNKDRVGRLLKSLQRENVAVQRCESEAEIAEATKNIFNYISESVQEDGANQSSLFPAQRELDACLVSALNQEESLNRRWGRLRESLEKIAFLKRFGSPDNWLKLSFPESASKKIGTEKKPPREAFVSDEMKLPNLTGASLPMFIEKEVRSALITGTSDTGLEARILLLKARDGKELFPGITQLALKIYDGKAGKPESGVTEYAILSLLHEAGLAPAPYGIGQIDMMGARESKYPSYLPLSSHSPIGANSTVAVAMEVVPEVQFDHPLVDILHRSIVLGEVDPTIENPEKLLGLALACLTGAEKMAQQNGFSIIRDMQAHKRFLWDTSGPLTPGSIRLYDFGLVEVFDPGKFHELVRRYIPSNDLKLPLGEEKTIMFPPTPDAIARAALYVFLHPTNDVVLTCARNGEITINSGVTAKPLSEASVRELVFNRILRENNKDILRRLLEAHNDSSVVNKVDIERVVSSGFASLYNGKDDVVLDLLGLGNKERRDELVQILGPESVELFEETVGTRMKEDQRQYERQALNIMDTGVGHDERSYAPQVGQGNSWVDGVIGSSKSSEGHPGSRFDKIIDDDDARGKRKQLAVDLQEGGLNEEEANTIVLLVSSTKHRLALSIHAFLADKINPSSTSQERLVALSLRVASASERYFGFKKPYDRFLFSEITADLNLKLKPSIPDTKARYVADILKEAVEKTDGPFEVSLRRYLDAITGHKLSEQLISELMALPPYPVRDPRSSWMSRELQDVMNKLREASPDNPVFRSFDELLVFANSLGSLDIRPQG